MKLLSFATFLSFIISYGQGAQKESFQSLYLELYKDNRKLGSGTGFIIKSKTQNYLVTNYHVLTNKNPTNDEWLDPNCPLSPNKVLIMHNANRPGYNIAIIEDLYDKKGKPLWHEDRIGKEMVDVVELPLKDTIKIKTYPVDYKKSSYDDVLISTTERVFILGFPKGINSSPYFPVWKSGLLASEPDFDQEGKPIVWVDAITFPGMSGSPVYFKTNEVVKFKDGSQGIIAGINKSKFMGVFSHSHMSSVYGALWKASFLEKIFDSLP